MPKRLRPIGHEDRLSVVDHLDELRSRLIVCGAALIVVFGICFWESVRLLNALNRPLHHLTKQERSHIADATSHEAGERGHLLKAAGDFHRLSHARGLSAQAQSIVASAANDLTSAANA